MVLFNDLCKGHPEIQEIHEWANFNAEPETTTEMVVKYVNAKGESRIKGGKHLKASQAYPSMLLGSDVIHVCCG